MLELLIGNSTVKQSLLIPLERRFIGGREYSPIEVAAYEVAKNDGKVEEKDLPEVGSPEVERDTKVVECVGDAVGEATHDEQRDAKEQREVLPLTGKGILTQKKIDADNDPDQEVIQETEKRAKSADDPSCGTGQSGQDILSDPDRPIDLQ